MNSLSSPQHATQRGNYRPWTRQRLDQMAEAFPQLLDVIEDVRMASLIFPFRVSSYVLEQLIDWEHFEEDPFYRLLFPSMKMLAPHHRKQLSRAWALDDKQQLQATVAAIRHDLNPHPAGQKSLNVPAGETELKGVQHKYNETILLFPTAGQTCHAYCTYCFRWAQFIGDNELKFAQKEASHVFHYLEKHPEVSDILMTGGDPMVMKTRVLKKYLGPLCDPDFLPHIRSVRLGTRSLTFWPQRFFGDDDTGELMELLQDLVRAGRHVAVMAHLGHPRELAPPMFAQAVKEIQATGAVIRSQAPILKGINDDAEMWAEKWRREVSLGIVPYYMFVARDTGPRSFFEVPLASAYRIYRDAISQVTGLARTARGPSMSCTPGKVVVDGIAEFGGESAFVLRFLQCRDPEKVGKPFFARYDEKAVWYDELEPFGDKHLPWGSSESGSVDATTPMSPLQSASDC